MKIGHGTLLAALLLGTCAAGEPSREPLGKYQTLRPVQIYVGGKQVRAKGDPDRFSLGICDKTTKNCAVSVTVDAGCHVQLDPQYMGLRGDGEFKLVYSLVSRGAKFADKPIVWTDTGGAHLPPGSSVNAEGTVLTVTLQNKPGTLRRLAYTLAVVNGGKTCPPLDPGVIPDL